MNRKDQKNAEFVAHYDDGTPVLKTPNSNLSTSKKFVLTKEQFGRRLYLSGRSYAPKAGDVLHWTPNKYAAACYDSFADAQSVWENIDENVRDSIGVNSVLLFI